MVVPNQTEPGNRITIAVEVWTRDYLRFRILSDFEISVQFNRFPNSLSHGKIAGPCPQKPLRRHGAGFTLQMDEVMKPVVRHSVAESIIG